MCRKGIIVKSESHVAASYTGMLIGGIDFIMLLSDWLAERRENRIEAAKNEVRQEISNDLTAWNNRRLEAEKQGKEFTEPIPIPVKEDPK